MSATYKRWMMFVDGENLTIRAQKIAKCKGVDLANGGYPLYRRDTCFWPKALPANRGRLIRHVHAADHAERCYYYTCVQGDGCRLDEVRDELLAQNFAPVVYHKPKKTRAKGVDISLTKDMLMHAVMGNYDVAVLVAGDGDFLPLVEEVKRLGRRVVVAFWEDEEEGGLGPDLRRAADEFHPLQFDMSR